MNGSPDRGPAPRRLQRATVAAVLIGLLGTAYAAWRQDWTYDERIHLAWSERFLDTGDVERFSQNRFNTKTPIQVPNVLASRLARRAGLTDPNALRLATRLPTIACLALLLGASFLVVRPVFGPTAAHLATAALALDPNLAAHGSLATSDMAFALGAWLTVGAALAVAARPSVTAGAALGLALGFAFAAKFTAVLLAPALLLLPLAWARAPSRRELAGLAAALAVAAAMAYISIGAAYAFHGIGEPLGATRWRSGVMTRLAGAAPRLPSPLPPGFLTGIDFALGFESLGPGHHAPAWNIVVLGNRYPAGCWFYFGLLWMLKTPLLVAVAIAVGFFAAARAGLLAHAPPARYLAAVLACWLVYLSFFFTAQIGYRFALLCLPVAAALAAAGLALRPAAISGAWGAAVLGLALAEGAGYAGNPLSFTNAAVWPKRQVFRLITDSNVDWGQNRDKIQEWLARRAPTSNFDPVHVLPGHNTFSLNNVSGVWDFERHRWLREHASPGGHFGHTYLWFVVDDDLYSRFLSEERRLVSGPAAEGRCGGASLTRLPPGTRLDFTLDGPLEPGETWQVCVATEKGAQFGLRSVEGHAVFASSAPAGPPPEVLEEGQVAWFVLEPGTHAFTVSRIPNRRAWLPNDFTGRWMVRERSVSLAVVRGAAGAGPAPAPVDPSPQAARRPPALPPA